MSYQLGADATETDAAILSRLDERTAQIVQWQKAEDERRKWTLLFTVGGALFAAVRLGIIAIPQLRRRQAFGKLADPIPVSNPPRRRRRR
jgi:hypothetical protein